MIKGDAIELLKNIEERSINTCITSPPYWGLRNYNDESKQLGMEDTSEEFVENLVNVFKQVKRVLRDDGTVWLNLGDSYAKNKQLAGLPWRVALALQLDGWYLRQDIIWNKPNPMPESIRDRCTKAHEYIFLLTKKAKYYYDNEAIKEDAVSYKEKKWASHKQINHESTNKGSTRKFARVPAGWETGKGSHGSYNKEGTSKNGCYELSSKRNKRSVWTVTTKPFKGAHFATFPKDLIEPCVLAGCPKGGTVLDPFSGSGTTGIVAAQHNRNAVLLELNQEYIDLAKARINKEVANAN